METALQEKAFVAWLAAAQRVAFGTLTRLAAEKRTHHSPAVVTPLAVSAGGGMFPEDDDRLPCGADRRNGRHWLRVELSSTLLKYRTEPPRRRVPERTSARSRPLWARQRACMRHRRQTSGQRARGAAVLVRRRGVAAALGGRREGGKVAADAVSRWNDQQ